MKVAVFGAGTMGSGIAQVFAAKGHTALMYASSTASAQRHKDKLAASLNKKVAKGKMTQEAADDIMSRVLVEEFESAADADLVRLWVPARRPVCWTCWDEICLKRSCCIRCGGSFFPALCTNAQKNRVIKQKTLALSYFTTLSG